MFLELHFTPNFSKLDLFFLWQFVPMVMAIQATEASVSVSVQLNLKLIDMLDTAALLVCWWCLNLFRLVDCSSWTLAAAGRWFAPKTFSKLKQFSCFRAPILRTLLLSVIALSHTVCAIASSTHAVVDDNRFRYQKLFIFSPPPTTMTTTATTPTISSSSS